MVGLFKNLLTLAWALWFGGMVVLLLFVTQLFKKSHATGVDAAPVLFDTFANFQLIAGAIACISSTALSILVKRKVLPLLTMFLLVAFGCAIELRSITHRIDTLRLSGRTDTDLFKQLHGLSGAGYVLAASVLLISGFLWLNLALPIQTRRRTVPATDSPAAA